MHQQAKGAGGAIFALSALFHSIPTAVSRLMIVFLVFFLVDTVTGFAAAAIRGKVRSKSMTRMTLSKLVQYSAILTVFGGVAAVVSNWTPLLTGIGYVTYIECLSITENAISLHECGVNLGPLAPLLKKTARFFAPEVGPDAEVPATKKEEKTDA